MFKDLKVTLYDIFGYLLPGIVAVAALWLLTLTMFFPEVALSPLDLNSDMHLLLVIAAYFLGHVAQALGNVVAKLLSRKPEYDVLTHYMPTDLVELARKRAGKMLGANLKHLDAEWLVTLCDEALVACGSPGEREIFQYREGFYRGLSVAFGLLCTAVLVRAFTPGSVIELEGGIHPVPTSAWLFLCILLALCAWLIWRRFARFRRYRIQHAITGYLVTQAHIAGQRQVEIGDATLASPGEDG